MSSTVVATILTLADKMSPQLLTVGKNWEKLSKEEQRAAKTAMSAMNQMEKRAKSLASSIMKIGAGLAVAGIGLGFKEAFSMEKYRMQLETATKDTERAAEVMSYAMDLANKTPFEGGEMVAASAALEMASLSAEKYLTTLGDTAAGANKQIAEIQTQFVKAFATGQTGEFFDMINVSRASFEDFIKVNKLSTASLEGSQAALKAFLDEKFGGGMENLAKTTAGAWSTITGVTKSFFANLVGMGTDGTVRVGSALDNLRGKAQQFAGMIDKWQSDGTIDKYAREIGSALSKAWDLGEGVLTTLWKYKDVAIVLGTVGATIWGMQKAMAAYKTIVEVGRVATMLFNGSLSINPIMLLISAIGVALLSTKSMQDMLNNLSSAADGTSTAFENLGSTIATAIGGAIADSLRSLYNYAAWTVNLLASPFTDALMPAMTENDEFMYIPHRVALAGYSDIGDGSGYSYWAKPHANGTQYHTGGLALVGERGPELVHLPAGASVMTAERTRKLGGNVTVYNYITVTGAERSDEEIAEIVAHRIMEEVDNAW